MYKETEPEAFNLQKHLAADFLEMCQYLLTSCLLKVISIPA